MAKHKMATGSLGDQHATQIGKNVVPQPKVAAAFGDGAGASSSSDSSDGELEEVAAAVPPHVMVTEHMIAESKKKGTKQALDDIINEHIVAIRKAQSLDDSAVVVVVTVKMQKTARTLAKNSVVLKNIWKTLSDDNKVAAAREQLDTLIRNEAANARADAAEAAGGFSE
jgi:hypothetical protein